MAIIIGQSSSGFYSTWAWLRSPIGNNQNVYGGSLHNVEFSAPGFMTAQNTFFRNDQPPLLGSLKYLFVTTTVELQVDMWFKFGPRGPSILVQEDEQEILGKSAVLDNASQTIAITSDAYDGPFGFGQALVPTSSDIVSVYDFLPF